MSQTKQTIKEVIDRYFNLKSEMDSYKKQVDADNLTIKEYMQSNNKDSMDSDNCRAKLNYAEIKSFKEPELLAYLKSIGREDLIITKEVLDESALENAIYHGEIKPEDLLPYKVVVKQARLKVTALKKEAK